MYRTGNYSLDEVAKKFGISKAAIFKRFKRDEVKKGEHKDFIDKTVEEEVKKQFGDLDFLRENAQKFFEVRTKALQAVEIIERQQMSAMLKAHNEKRNLATIEDEIRVLGMMASNTNKNITSITKLREVDLDIDLAAGEPEEFIVRVISKDEVDEMARIQEAEDREMEGSEPDEPDPYQD